MRVLLEGGPLRLVLGAAMRVSGALWVFQVLYGCFGILGAAEGSRTAFKNTQNFFGVIANDVMEPLLRGEVQYCRFLLLCLILV